MKFVSYLQNGQTRTGVLSQDGSAVDEVVTPVDGVLSIIDSWNAGNKKVQTGAETKKLDELTLLAPIPQPRRNIICVGKNYLDHAHEFSRSGFDSSSRQDEALPTHPIFFTKPASSVIGTEHAIDPHADITSAVDYEAEVGVIIGRGGRRIEPQHAQEHIWGYTLINDVTARDLQRQHKQWFLGKSLDTFCPMGPWAVTSDEISGPLTIECRVNDELRQKATTDDLIFDIPTLISTLSAGITLQPGDIIATGTPVGVGIGFDPPKFLQPGDVVSVSATGLGTLRNHLDVPAF